MDFDPARGALSLGPDDIRRLREDFGLDSFPGASFSELFVAQIYAMQLAGEIASYDVTDEVAALEGQRSSHTKPAEPFMHAPLLGLWHKHFFTARNMVTNLLNQIRKPWFGAELDKLGDESTLIDVNEVAKVAVTDAYLERHRNGELTGHWIIFAVHERRRYYLSVTRHARSRADDIPIYRPIASICSREFPFLGLAEVS